MDYNAQAKDTSTDTSKKIRCDECKGSGLVLKKDIPKCNVCEHILTCTYCNQNGKGNHPYEECSKCWGYGDN